MHPESVKIEEGGPLMKKSVCAGCRRRNMKNVVCEEESAGARFVELAAIVSLNYLNGGAKLRVIT